MPATNDGLAVRQRHAAGQQIAGTAECDDEARRRPGDRIVKCGRIAERAETQRVLAVGKEEQTEFLAGDIAGAPRERGCGFVRVDPNADVTAHPIVGAFTQAFANIVDGLALAVPGCCPFAKRNCESGIAHQCGVVNIVVAHFAADGD